MWTKWENVRILFGFGILFGVLCGPIFHRDKVIKINKPLKYYY